MMEDNIEEMLSELRHLGIPSCDYKSSTEIQHNNRTDSILNLNIRGLRANLAALEEFTDSYSNLAHVKIIALTEIFNADSQDKNNYLKTHTLTSACRDTNPNRGGVGIMVQNQLQFTVIDIEDSFLEGLFESITILVPAMKAIVTCIYRPNAHANSNTDNFITRLTTYIDQLKRIPEYRNHSSYILGDFNLNMNNHSERHTRNYINTMITNMYIPLIHVNTRCSHHSETLIDQCWTNNLSVIQDSFVIEDTFIADHFINGFNLVNLASTSTRTIMTRRLKEENLSDFRSALEEQSWEDIYAEENCNRKWEKLTHHIKSALDKTCPKREIKIKANSAPKKCPWITKELIDSNCTLKRLATAAKKHPTQIRDGNTLSNWETFCAYRKTHSKNRRSAKRTYYYERFNEIKHNCKETWKLINNIISRKASDNNINELTYKGVTVKSEAEICEAFNDFYSNVGTTQAATIPHTDTDPLSFLRGLPPESLFLHPCTEEETIKATKKLSMKKSKGPDDIPCFILFKNVDILARVITHCINYTFETGIFPTCLKEALVIPIYKKKCRTLPTNYRPVSLLNALSKIAEKIINQRLYNFMEKKLCQTQFGFRPKYQTTDLMIFTIEKITQIVEEEGYAVPLFFDLGKAFDTLNHNTLLNKLYLYGIRGTPLDLLKSYLSDRKQKVSVNGTESQYLPIDIGVPQGSILGPLLFIIYVNDILNAATEANIGLYADDTTCITGDKSQLESIEKAKTALRKLGDWFASNKLSLSPTKCKYALIDRSLRTSATKTTLEIYGKNLTEVRASTDSTNSPLVGYLLTETLNPKEHIDMMIAKVRSGIFALKANKGLPSEVRKSIYYACIHSHLCYAGIIVGCAARKHIKPLLKLQNMAIRLIDGAKYNASTNPLYKKHHILKIDDIFEMQAASYGWKFLNNEIPTALAKFISKGSDRTLHLKGKLYTKQNLKQLSPIDFCIRCWNSLPIDLKKSKSMNIFKNAYCNMKLETYI